MARKPKPNPRSDRRASEPQWQHENQSSQPGGRIQWMSAHEYTTSEDTLRTPKAEEKPGIGAPSARQERDALPNESDTPSSHDAVRPRAKSHDRTSRTRRRPGARSRRDATARTRRSRKAH